MGKERTEITIQEEQKEWLKEQDKNLSYMVRKMLDQKMKE